MRLSTALEQHIAVFGESGSGKTVLVSSFYGATQEPQYLQKSLFNVVADDIGQGNALHRNYLGMRDSGRLPIPTRFTAASYSFSVKLKDGSDPKVTKGRPFDALRLVWHDYPGEWFEQEVSGSEEARRRIDTFRSLLRSDVGIILVDGQKLLDNAGEEERYLRSLLANFRNGLLTLKDELLDDGAPLVEFPRIWMMALSKSDLLPDVDVYRFRDLLVDKAGEDIDQLRQVLASLVEAPEALSVGEDFLLLSSAKFGADKIEVTKRVGLELVLPLAAMLPLDRHLRWAQAKNLPGKVAENLLAGIEPLADVIVGRLGKVPGRLGRLVKIVGPGVNYVTKIAGEKLRDINAEAVTQRDNLRATLTRFGMDLDKGEEEHVLLRSRR